VSKRTCLSAPKRANPSLPAGGVCVHGAVAMARASGKPLLAMIESNHSPPPRDSDPPSF